MTTKKTPLLFTCLAFLIPCLLPFRIAAQQQAIELNDLSAFKNPAPNWKIAGSAYAEFGKNNKIVTTPGTGVLVNTAVPGKGSDLLTAGEFGDFDLELDYMMGFGANSGIYIQGRYEIQLFDNWGEQVPNVHGNGAVYERWNDAAPEGKKGYQGHAPRMVATRAPGTWQHIKISYQAPTFDDKGAKLTNAKILRIELNGVVLHENVELSGPTRGSIDNNEVSRGPLRFQGDHGTVAFRNLMVTSYNKGSERPTVVTDPAQERDPYIVDPILVRATSPTIHRSFMDVPGSGRLTHTVSVGFPEKVHFTYDPLTGNVVQVWRGEFLDATPMWHDRGNGSSKPDGAVQYLGKPAPAFAVGNTSSWPADTVNTGFKTKGYIIDEKGIPSFRYTIFGMNIEDKLTVADLSRGFNRELSVSGFPENAYFRMATAANIRKLNNGSYLVDDAYYIITDKNTGAVSIRDGANGSKELVVPVRNKIAYTILF